MIKNKVVLKCENTIADNPNLFIRMCSKLSSTYRMNISSMKEFNSSDRSFGVELIGSSDSIKIKFNYESQELEYELYFKNEELGAFVEKQIVEAITTVRFKTGDVIFDWLGNKYIVVHDENRPISDSGVISHYRIQVKDDSNNEKEILNTSVSLWF